MKPKLLFALLAAALIAGITGCKSVPYDPSVAPLSAPHNKIAVVGIKTVPAKPVAHQPWKVVMQVRNVSKAALHDVAFEFVYDGNKKIGPGGLIPQINPGETVQVVSDTAEQFSQGFYHIEGRVFLKDNAEPEYADRMDNWRTIGVTVAQ